MSAQGILREDASCQSFGERNDLLPPIFDEISLSCFREFGFLGGGRCVDFLCDSLLLSSSFFLSFSSFAIGRVVSLASAINI